MSVFQIQPLVNMGVSGMQSKPGFWQVCTVLFCTKLCDFFSDPTIKPSVVYREEVDRVRDTLQDTRCIFRASVATLGGLSTEKSHEQVLLKSIQNMQVQIIRYIWTGDDEIET